MYTYVNSYTIYGIDAILVKVEISITPGLSKFEIIGLPDASIRESKERIFQSIRELEYEVPLGNITINLSPGEIKKKGTIFDLPIAIGLLIASKQITPLSSLEQTLMAGELTLKGQVISGKGLYNAWCLANELKLKTLISPPSDYNFNSEEGTVIKLVTNLKEAISTLVITDYQSPFISDKAPPKTEKNKEKESDYSEVMGNDLGKVAIQLAIVSRLNLLFIGPPGSGKSMLLKRIPSVLYSLSANKRREVTKIHSAAGIAIEKELDKPPFRVAHSSISDIALLGGGPIPTPGEISLSHHGFLFMDEFSEFNRRAIQSIRSPIEDKKITIRRAQYSYTLPCAFSLVAAMNPCPCGYYGDKFKMCQCTPQQINRYYQRISGPILDRFHIILYISPPDKKNWFSQNELSSEQMKKNIQNALVYAKNHRHDKNMTSMLDFIRSKPNLRSIIEDSKKSNILSLRRVSSTLRVALTISLLEQTELNESHLYQAIHFSKYKWGYDQTNSQY